MPRGGKHDARNKARQATRNKARFAAQSQEKAPTADVPAVAAGPVAAVAPAAAAAPSDAVVPVAVPAAVHAAIAGVVANAAWGVAARAAAVLAVPPATHPAVAAAVVIAVISTATPDSASAITNPKASASAPAAAPTQVNANTTSACAHATVDSPTATNRVRKGLPSPPCTYNHAGASCASPSRDQHQKKNSSFRPSPPNENINSLLTLTGDSFASSHSPNLFVLRVLAAGTDMGDEDECIAAVTESFFNNPQSYQRKLLKKKLTNPRSAGIKPQYTLTPTPSNSSILMYIN